MITYNADLKIFYSTKINDAGIFSGFGTRDLDNGKKVANVLDFFAKNNIHYRKIVLLGQIHSTNIIFFKSKLGLNIETIEDTDGIITKESETLLVVRTADCLPIIFVDKTSGILGISHQGWRGSLKKMASKMVGHMVDEGANKNQIIAAIGPGIGRCCYDVNEDRYYQFLEEFDGYSKEIFQLRGGKRHVDLTRLNYLLLLEAGVEKTNIDCFPFCTYCDKSRFFSFRRDKNTDYKEMFHFIMKTDRPKLFTPIETAC